MGSSSSKRTWVGGGAVAAVVLGADPRPASACHEDPDVPGYEKSWSLGLVFGVAFGVQTRFVYGLDVRVTGGQLAGLARVEARGLGSVRLTMAGQGVTDGRVLGELGVALHSARKHTDIDFALGLHVAGGLYDDGGGIQANGLLPLYGDRRNYDVSAMVALVPNEVKLCLGGGRRLRMGEASILPSAAMYGGAEAPSAVAHAYVGDARTEYASVWAFERMAAELAAAGAPGDLVRAARAAASDEVRHARMCAELAGVPFSLLPLADDYLMPRWSRPCTAALMTLAHEAWLDGCVGEGIAARQAGSAADRARGRAAEAQHAISSDERRHAELAWSVLEWAWRQRDARVRDGIADAIRTELEVPDATSPDVDPDELAARGRLTRGLARDAAADELAEVRARGRRLLERAA